ncbi:MAG: hypothetical protein AAGL96_04535 [Pseudomonadota bacterium]
MRLSTEGRLIIGILATVAWITGIVSLFPALDSGGFSPLALIPQDEFDLLVQSEQDHCDAFLDGVNCKCFGDVSGIIQADQTPRVPDAFYADRQDLARWQAADKC